MAVRTVALIGRGAVGSLYAGLMAENVPERFIVAADADRIARYRKEGFQANGHALDLPYGVPEEPVDLVLIATKFTALQDVLSLMRPLVGPNTIIVSLINGISSEDRLREAFGRDHVIRAIAQKMDARYTGQAVSWSTPGEIVIGAERTEDEADVAAVAAFFEEAGIPYVISSNIVKDQWSKLMVNCALNQISAAYDVPYGAFIENEEIRQLFQETMKEVQAVAEQQGIEIPDADLAMWQASIDGYNPESMPSMRQDVLAGRRTEKELFSGTIVPLAHEAGIPVPHLEDLYRRICQIEEKMAPN